jgi:hypothetical protein
MKFLNDQYDAPVHNGYVNTTIFGGGQGWGIRTESVHDLVNAVYQILERDNQLEGIPDNVKGDIKTGILNTFLDGNPTDKWGG